MWQTVLPNSPKPIQSEKDFTYGLRLPKKCAAGCDGVFFFFFFFFLFSLFFLGLYLWHREGSRLGTEPELQLRQHQILNPRSEARMEPVSSWLLVEFFTYWATTGTPVMIAFKEGVPQYFEWPQHGSQYGPSTGGLYRWPLPQGPCPTTISILGNFHHCAWASCHMTIYGPRWPVMHSVNPPGRPYQNWGGKGIS